MSSEEKGEQKIQFKNCGGPYQHTDGKIKLPGRVFKAYPSEISESLRIHLIPLDGSPDPANAPLPNPKTKSEYKIESKGGAYFNVVQVATGRTMNEKGLKKDAAEELVISLEK